MKKSGRFLSAWLGCFMLLGVGGCNGVWGDSSADSPCSQSSKEEVTEEVFLGEKFCFAFRKNITLYRYV